ncbi:restriction endonuclease fold toxin-2 domain-containing protein [Cystobacter ferrugineus]|nr:restriction endonuclease fold toxin-2 domain-containing protein [Cystobacter ferrugineus]
MSALSGIWLASQGVPVVGEGVDAALATLGIILLGLATGDDLARRFQRTHAGEEEFLVQGGGARIWADGVNHPDAHLVEVKYIKDAVTSPFIEGSKCPEVIRAKIRKEVGDEFERYAAILKDSETPAAGLEDITNNVEAASHFASLMKRLNIPGRVRVITGGRAP